MKAVAIMSMVLGHAHSSYHTDLVAFVNQFHMPIFFFVSGFCFKDNYLKKPSSFIKQRITGLWLPFVKWGGYFLLLHNVFYYLNIYNDQYGFRLFTSHLYSVKETLVLAKETVLFNHIEGMLGGYWFLRTLFFASLLSYIFLLLFKSLKFGCIIGIIVTSVSMIALNCHPVHLIYIPITSQTMAATFLFLMGYAFKRYGIKCIPWYISLLLILLPFLGIRYWEMYLASEFYDNSIVFQYLVAAILFSWGLYSLFDLLKSNNLITRVLNQLGNNTLPVLTWHFLSFKIVSLLIIVICGLPIARLAELPVIVEYSTQGWFVLYFIVTMIITYYISKHKFLR